MAYKCPQCGQASDHEGDCPTCNLPMTEEKETEEKEEEGS